LNTRKNPLVELLYLLLGILNDILQIVREMIIGSLGKFKNFFGQHISFQAVFFLSLISFTTSYYGFLSLVSDGLFLTKVLFFAVVAVIQIALVYSINQLYIREFFSRYIIRAILLSLTYFLSLFISVLFSFNFYYKIFSASEFANQNVTMQLEDIKENLEDAESSFNSIYLSLKDLSDYSMEKSIEEGKVGGTCDETRIPLPGPRSALRKYESQLFHSHLEEVKKIGDNITKEVKSVKSVLAKFNPKKDDIRALEEMINKKIDIINRLFRGGEISLLPKVLISHKGSARMEMLSLGRKISCPDSKITQKINTIIENLNTLRFLKKVTFFDPNNKHQLIERTINVLLAIVPFTDVKIVATDKVKNPTDVTQSDIKAIGLGFLVDFFIFFFTILSKDKYYPKFFDSNTIRKYMRYNLRRTLKPFVFEGHFFNYLIVPNQKKNKKIDEIITRFQVDKLITLSGSNIEYNELLAVHQYKLRAFKDGTFQVYKLNKAKYDALLAELDSI